MAESASTAPVSDNPPDETVYDAPPPQPEQTANPFAEEDKPLETGEVQDDGTQEYGFSDDSVRQYEYDLYKARKGQTDRIGFLTTKIIGARCHFKQGVGYFICHSVFEVKRMQGQIIEIPKHIAPCCKTGDSPRKRFIAPIIKYNTDPSGKLLPDFGYALMVWRFTDDKYIQLRTMNEEFSLDARDILVTCTNEDWQKLTLQPAAKSLWRQMADMPKVGPDVKARMREAYDTIVQWANLVKPKLGRSLGRKFSQTELLEKLGMAAPAPTVVMEAPMMDVRELLE